jgi:hypothetical protein
MFKPPIRFCFFAFLAFALSIVTQAQSQSTAKPTAGNEPIANTDVSSNAVTWLPHTEYSSLVLTISTPSGGILRQEFPKGVNPSFYLTNQNGFTRPDGHYTYELRLVPVLSAETRAALAASRESGNNDVVARQLQDTGQLPAQAVTQSGSFLVTGGMIFSNASVENTNRQSDSHTPRQANMAPIGPLPNDQVTADDLIVQGSACIGLDCVDGETFGFDTLRLKENNTRITFTDTSTSAGFANNVWTLTANDSASGGANKFSIDDVTGAKTPFTVIAGAPTNSFFLNNLGKLGLRTATPGLDIHMNTTDTPAVRFEQNSSGGFTAQTWDIGANEANFFVRDLTGGSRLPFRVRPGAPTSSIDIAATGNVGIGTSSPGFKLDVAGSINASSFFLNSAPFNPTSFDTVTGTTMGQIAKWTDNKGTLGNSVISESGGNVGIGTTSPGAVLDVVGGSFNTGFRLRSGANGAGLTLANSDTGGKAYSIISTGSANTPGAGALSIYDDSLGYIASIKGGNFGVGTIAPLNRLVVRGTAAGFNESIFRVERATDGAVALTAGFGKDGTNSMFLGTATNHPFALTTNDTERMRVSNSGNVGIGTTTPQSTLQVNGYVQLALTAGAPPAVDCDNVAEYGRMKVDATGNKLYVCTSTGWKSTTLAP